VHVDVYGNLITNLRRAAGEVTIAGLTLPIVRTYEDVAPGAVLAYVGSMGTVEIAVRDRDASSVLGLDRGEPIT
jgi:S-adenosylmethionine hydrolase